ncbi:MAG: hypothetical protein AAGE52_19905 [Myxococcota bacterium]
MTRVPKGALVLATLLASVTAEAQSRRTVAGLRIGSGLSLGTSNQGEDASLTQRRTPIYLEADVRTWIDATPDPVVGAALRVEVDGRVSAAIVPRAQLMRQVGSLEVRAMVGAPFFFAPFSLLGGEAGFELSIPLGGGWAIATGLRVDVFFWGSDLPSGTAIVAIDAVAGMELRL